jgi:hypothetical protein
MFGSSLRETRDKIPSTIPFQRVNGLVSARSRSLARSLVIARARAAGNNILDLARSTMKLRGHSNRTRMQLRSRETQYVEEGR